MSDRTLKYEGITSGTINDQEYESVTEMTVDASGMMRGRFSVLKLPTGFDPALLSLSNSSQKATVLARPEDDFSNMYELMHGRGKILTSRTYSYPKFPDASFSQTGTADLSEAGLLYKNVITGFSGSLPSDIIEIKPYEQIIRKRSVGGLELSASTILVSASIGEVQTEIRGTYSFAGDDQFPLEITYCHQPQFFARRSEFKNIPSSEKFNILGTPLIVFEVQQLVVQKSKK